MRLTTLVTTTIMFGLSISFAIAQNYKTYLKQGDRAYRAKNYSKAVKLYKKAEKLKKGNAQITYKIGLAYLFGTEKTQALSYLKTVKQINGNIDREVNYHLGEAYRYNYQFKEAKRSFEEYAAKNPKMIFRAERKIKECTMADSLFTYRVGANVTNMGVNINSPYNDYTPLITGDGNMMVFTSNRSGSTGGLRLRDGTYYEDIYMAKKENGTWVAPEKISPKINFKYHDAAVSISPDGKKLLLYYESGGGDIYESNFENGEWTEPQPIPGRINTPYWETAVSITRDGKTLYFTSNRPGGYGRLDIYKSVLKENGEWGIGQNLGEMINTEGSEDSPFIHPNGDVLYFSSNGHLGMGGHDVYYSEMIDGKFQKPVNMGYPINTVFSDNYFVISENKKQAYYASVREDAIGMADIYSIDMTAKPISVERKSDILAEVDQPTSINSPDLKSVDVKIVKTEVENEPVEEESEDFYDEVVTLQKELGIITLLKGKVIDATSGQPLKARIKLMDNVQNRQIGEVSSNSETGEFELIIPHGGNYGVNTIKGGYLFNSINFNLPTFSDFQEIDTHILMQKAEIGSKVVLKNVFFDSGKSGLRTESLSELDRIKELLEDNNQVQVQINGHTDNVGNAAYNKILSRKRAQSVVNYLIRNGVDKTRLTAKGYGEERPLVSNDDEKDGREINRRTEIEIIGINKGI